MLTFLSDPPIFLLWLLALLTAITVHEFAHAYIADKLGDPTPRVQGRLTLNPLAHLDTIGTIALLAFGFGWGKPVQFDPFNLANPRRDAALISFAGPCANLITALSLSILGNLAVMTGTVGIIAPFSIPFIHLNIVLAIFNLVPIHPLDGGKILVGLLPQETAARWDRFLGQYGMLILIFLILPVFGREPIILKLIGPTIDLIFRILNPTGGILLF